DDHFAAGPDCCVINSGLGRVDGAGGCPTVGAGIVSPAGVKIAATVPTAPDDHFAAGPRFRVHLSAIRRIVCGGSFPTIVRAASPIGDCRKAVIASTSCNLVIDYAGLSYLPGTRIR